MWQNEWEEIVSFVICSLHLQIWWNKLLERFICQLHETMQAGGTEDDSAFFSQSVSSGSSSTLVEVTAQLFNVVNVTKQITKLPTSAHKTLLSTRVLQIPVRHKTSSYSFYGLMKATLVQKTYRIKWHFNISHIYNFTLELDIDILKTDWPATEASHIMYPVKLPLSKNLYKRIHSLKETLDYEDKCLNL